MTEQPKTVTPNLNLAKETVNLGRKWSTLVSSVLLWVVWSDDWTETLSIHSMDRMDSCGVISTLQCFFHHWYDNECIPSLFIHLKEWERQTRSSYPILTLINPIHLYLISLFTHTHWTTVYQTIRWITNQRDAQSNSYTHTLTNVIVIGRGRVTTLLSTSSIRVLKNGSIRDNTSHPRFNNESYHFSRYDKSNRAIWFDKREERNEWNPYSCEGSSCRMR